MVPGALAAIIDPMAERLRWSERFAVGHEVIDSEHRMLMQLINDVSAATTEHRSRVAPLLQQLGQVVKDHFRTENSVLWELRSGKYQGLRGSPAARHLLAGMATTVFDEHMTKHATLLARFEEIARTPVEILGDTLKN